MLLGKSFDIIDIEIINGLVLGGVSESVSLDYKKESYGNTDKDKRELLKDISALANTLGGYIVLGIDEINGVATSVTPITGLDIDAECLRLEQVIRSGLEPSLVGLRLKTIPANGGHVIIVHVPRSMNPPHRVIAQGSNRYYARHSSGTYEPSVEELRLLFGQRRTMEEDASTFARERCLRLAANDGIVPLPVDNGVFVMHLIPIADRAISRRHSIALIQAHEDYFRPIGASGMSSRINLEGLCIYRSGEICHGYTQVFRDGTIESTSNSLIGKNNGRRILPALVIPERILHFLPGYIAGLQAMDATPPLMVHLSFINVVGVELGIHQSRMFFGAPPPFMRNEIHLSPIMISDYRENGDYQALVADQMHQLWNAFDFPRCFYFNDADEWIGERH